MGRKYTFFDACAGIGCFHLGMEKAGFDCVGAAEIDAGLQERYPEAFGLEPGRMFGDVSRITEAEGWDMHREGMQGATVVAGFPCTPWSKSGSQTGKVHDEGMVFWGLLDLMDEIGSEAFVFENVTNLLGEAHSEVWGEMQSEIMDRGYHVGHDKISTRDVGIPQNRNRVFIVGRKADGEEPSKGYFQDQFEDIKSAKHRNWRLRTKLRQAKEEPGTPLSQKHREALHVWDKYLGWASESREILEGLPKPLWAMESWYRERYKIGTLQSKLEDSAGRPLEVDDLRDCLKGYWKRKSKGMGVEEIVEEMLPPYYRKVALGSEKDYSERLRFAQNSRAHMDVLRDYVRDRDKDEWNDWRNRLKAMKPSFQKFEYHLGRKPPADVSDAEGDARLGRRFGGNLVQFRSSGVRVSKNDVFPTLVAIGQVPYTGERLEQPHWKSLAALQSIPKSHYNRNEALFGTGNEPVRRIGNAVNVKIVTEIGSRLRPLLA